MATKPPVPIDYGVPASDLRSVIDSLDLVEQEGCAYGVLRNAVIESELGAFLVTATYFEGEWRVLVAPK